MVIRKLLRHVHLVIPEELLAEVDDAATQKYMSRSEYIRRVLEEKVGGKFPETIQKIRRENPAKFLDQGDS